MKGMVKWLLKAFVKDYEQTDDPKVRARYGVFSGIVGILLNVLLFSAKLVAGLLTMSISIIADALNNLSDAGSSVVTLVGFRLSEKPADPEHPFGHGRMEYVAGFIVSAVILFVGLELVKTSVEKIISPSEVNYGLFSVIVMAVAVLVKLFMFAFNRSLAKRIGSDAMKTTSMDSLTDAVATSAVLAGIAVTHFTGFNADGYLGIIVALFILWTGFSSAKSMVDLLLGKAPDKALISEIEQTVLAHKEVIGVHDVIVHNYGAGRSMVSLHAEVPSDENVLELHDSIDLIEMELRQKFHCDAVIHMDPIETDNELVSEMREKILEIVRGVGEGLSMHDFRMVTGKSHTNLIFDVVVPYRFPVDDREIIRAIRRGVQELSKKYYVVVKLDRPYC